MDGVLAADDGSRVNGLVRDDGDKRFVHTGGRHVCCFRLYRIAALDGRRGRFGRMFRSAPRDFTTVFWGHGINDWYLHLILWRSDAG